MDKFKLLSKIDAEIRHMETEGGFGIELMRQVQDYVRRSHSVEDDEILRDHFAGQAMQALLQADDGNTDPEIYPFNARFAYRMANEMMQERKRLHNPADVPAVPTIDVTKAIRDENF